MVNGKKIEMLRWETAKSVISRQPRESVWNTAGMLDAAIWV